MLYGHRMADEWEASLTKKLEKSSGVDTLPKPKPEKPGRLPKPVKEMTLKDYLKHKGLNHNGLNFTDSHGRNSSAMPAETIAP